MRQWLIKQLPELVPVTQEDDSEGLIHRLLVCADVFFGQFGSGVTFITISSRTAVRCRNPDSAPLWALILGVFLEKINPGHLQSAMNTDLGRALQTQQFLQGK